MIDDAHKSGDLLTIQPTSPDNMYVETNHAIIHEALALGLRLQRPVTAALVWDGKSRGQGDLTEEFGAYARHQGLRIVEVKSCGP
jgi:hypothetical protein